jgi:AraC-like DNA-binding protein
VGKDSSVSAMAVLDLHDQLLQLGVVTPAQMCAAGVHREHLIDTSSAAPAMQEQRIEESRLLALWHVAVSNPSLPHIGLLLGQQINPEARGVLASWLLHCARVDEAFAIFVNHIALMNPSECWQASEDENGLELTFSFASGKPYPQAASERSMSALLHWHRAFTGVQVLPLGCDFAFAEPAYVQRFVDVFGSNLRFARPHNRLHLPRSFLQHPIRGASPYLKQLLQERALHTYAQLQRDTVLVGRVRTLIEDGLQRGAGIEHVCAALHLSRPTLYRRLKQDGTSYSELLETIRQQLAERYAQQGMTAAQISERLGFKDIGTLHRALKRWAARA